MKNIKKYIIPLLFNLLLFITAVFYILVPDKQISHEENRILTKFPDVSLSNIAGGHFTNNFNSYMNDQFPFRSLFIKIGDGIDSFMHLDTKTTGGVNIIVNAGNAGGGAGERLNGDENEIKEKDYVSEAGQGSSLIIDSNGRAMEYYSFNYSDLAAYSATINKFASELPHINLYSMIIPTSSEFYLSKDLQRDNYSQQYAIDTVYSMTVPEVRSVDVISNLYKATQDKNNYIYFRTDHHWTARGAYEGYRAFCEAAGFTASDISKMPTARVEGDFLGSFTRLTKNEKLLANPDYIDYYLQGETEDTTAYTDADMATPYDTDLFVNPGDAQNKYMVFLGGDNPLTRIITKSDTDRNLLIVKDSFGNALVPFLVPHYKEIYVLDPRTAHTDIRQFCKEHDIDDFIIETYTFSLSNSGICNLLETLLPTD